MSGQPEWKRVRGSWIAKTPVLSGVWARKESGHVVRGRVLDPRTGKKREIWKVLPEATAMEAKAWLDGACDRIRRGVVEQVLARERLGGYASKLLDRKVNDGDIRSEAGAAKWREVLRRLGKFSLFDLYVDAVRTRDILAWRSEMARLVREGEYSPSTGNTDLAVLRVVLRHAKLDFELPENPARDVPAFDTSGHRTYTREQPNSLTSSELRAFLACMREKFPQHFAMVFAGFVTGLRPSTLRPLRRAGPTPDVLWDERVLLVRRSHTLGEVTMVGTKTGVDLEITVPEELLEVLRWHVATQLETKEQKESELLFPSETGGFRARTVLEKPFAAVTKALGLKKRITPRAMRRTFQDLCREARVADVVTRSICGHATEAMQRRYSTVSGSEQADGLARVIRLFEGPSTPAPTSSGEGGGEGTQTAQTVDEEARSEPSLPDLSKLA
jgi:site-specific recombinase XerC